MLYDPGEVNQTTADQIEVAPHGTPVDVSRLIHSFQNRPQESRVFSVAVMRSTDRGASWSQPARVS